MRGSYKQSASCDRSQHTAVPVILRACARRISEFHVPSLHIKPIHSSAYPVPGLLSFISILIAFAFWASGCAVPPPSGYLGDQVEKASQDEILAKFGEPRSKEEHPDGGEVWTYRYVRSVVMGTGSMGKRLCTEYRLSFDEEGILREWEEQRC